MPNRSKFTTERRARIVERLSAGASRRTAAAAVGIDHVTLLRWLRRGETAHPEGRWAEFLRDVREAEARPKMRALASAYRGMADDPDLALRYLERSEPGFALPEPEPSDGHTVIQLKLPPSPRSDPEP